jgi:hypothetical protein
VCQISFFSGPSVEPSTPEHEALDLNVQHAVYEGENVGSKYGSLWWAVMYMALEGQ